MRALLRVRGVGAEADEGGADVVARFHRGGRVAAVELEDVAPVRDAVRLRQLDELVREVVVERARQVLQADGDGAFVGGLARRGDGDVQAHHLGDVAVQRGRCPRSHLLGDGEQRVHVHRQRRSAVPDGLAGGEQHGHGGLVVQVARVDVATGLHLGLRVESDPVAHVDAGLGEIGRAGRWEVQPHLDVVPGVRLGVDGIAEGVARGHQRQAGASDLLRVGEQREPRTLGKARGPGADGHHAHAAIGLQLAHHGAQRVQVGHDGARRVSLAALERGADGAAARDFVGNAQPVETARDIAHHGVGQAHGAGDRQQLQQGLFEVRLVERRQGFKGPLIHGAATSVGAVPGKSRSTKRCAVGCGS